MVQIRKKRIHSLTLSFYDSFLILSEYLSASFQTRSLSNRHGFHRKNTPPAFLPEEKKSSLTGHLLCQERIKTLDPRCHRASRQKPCPSRDTSIPGKWCLPAMSQNTLCKARPQRSIWQSVSHLTFCTASSLQRHDCYQLLRFWWWNFRNYVTRPPVWYSASAVRMSAGQHWTKYRWNRPVPGRDQVRWPVAGAPSLTVCASNFVEIVLLPW